MQVYNQTFNSLLENEADGWLKSQRVAAFARFEHLGFPSRKVENWKYTNTRYLADQEFNLATRYNLSAAKELLANQGLQLDAYRLVLVNGVFCPELSNLENLPDTCVIEPLSHGLETNLEATCGLIGRFAGLDTDIFTAFNLAYVKEGAVIRLGKEVRLNKPLLISYLSTHENQLYMSHPRVVIAAGSNSQFELIEEFISQADAANLTNRVLEGVLERNVQLNHSLIQQVGCQDTWVGRIEIEVKKQATYNCYHLNLGGKLVRDDLSNNLTGEGANSNLRGLLIGKGKQHLDAHTLATHNAQATNSYANYRSLLDDSARGVFNTRVVVTKEGAKTFAEQRNANLLLNEAAHIDTKPELEIYNDDVACAHGATTGQLDADAIFYLQSRGLTHAEAVAQLTLAFAESLLTSFARPEIVSFAHQRLLGQLPVAEDLALEELIAEDAAKLEAAAEKQLASQLEQELS